LREWQIRLLLAVAIPAAIVLSIEIFLRMAGMGFRPEYWISVPERSFLISNDRFAWRFLTPLLARTPVPEIVEPKKPRDTRRIFVLGESAAMGFPEPAFGIARMLEVILRFRYPNVNWEVRNVAMTAINSHVIVPIARDCARLEPDAFVVLTGNNEAVGPYGPGTVFGGAGLPLPLARLAVWQSATRIGEVATSLIRDSRPAQTEWRGMEMFTDHQIAASDARLERMYQNFEANLKEITAIGLRSGAAVVLATVPVNLKDCPPFASLHRTDMAESDRAHWTSAFERAKNAETRGAAADAVAAYEEAVKIDAEFAETQFRLARALLTMGNDSRAAEHYRRARDQDALRFRTDSKLNAIIRNTARGMEQRAVSLVDADGEFGLAGEDLFFEHVHLTPKGNYKLAAAVADKLAPAVHKPPQGPGDVQIHQALALTRWDESRMRSQVAALMERAPFTAQADHKRLLARFKSTIESGPLHAMALPAYEAAIKDDPNNIHLRGRYAALLRESGRPADAAAQWTVLIDRVPGFKAWYASRGAAFSDAGRQAEAIRDYTKALDLDKHFDLAHFGLGVASTRQERYEEAVRHYQKAIDINPNYADAAYNLAGVLSRMGKIIEAEAAVRRALTVRPDFAQGHVALAQILAKSGKTDVAIEHYKRALQLDAALPDAHYDLGVLLARAGRSDEAIEHYGQAIRLRPDYAEAYNNLGTALARKGDAASAGRAFAQAVRIKPSYEAAISNLRRLQQSNAPPR
jgi:tetratricopeptide (TPR) repeat protein